VLIHRSFQSGKKDSRVRTPDDYRAMRGDIKKMVQDLRSQFILRRAGGTRKLAISRNGRAPMQQLRDRYATVSRLCAA
jgi:hypothetical protein